LERYVAAARPELPDPLTPALWPRELTADNPDGEWFADVDGNWLVRTSRLAERGDIVVVAMRTEKADELISRVTNVAIITSAVAIAALALLSPRVVRRSLRPLDDISETAAAIGSGDLTRRVDGADARTEVGKLGTALNAMLGQIDHPRLRRTLPPRRGSAPRRPGHGHAPHRVGGRANGRPRRRDAPPRPPGPGQTPGARTGSLGRGHQCGRPSAVGRRSRGRGGRRRRPGGAVDDLPHVFERFYRGDSERLRDHGGAGLGLSIVSSVAAAHGGTATVKSRVGDGTTFVVRLPLGDVRA